MKFTRTLLLVIGLCICCPATFRSEPTDTRPSQSVGERAKMLSAQKQFATAQKLIEDRLTQNPPQDQLVLLQNALADVHFAWGNNLKELNPPNREQAIAHYLAAYETDKLLRPNQAGVDLIEVGGRYIDLQRYQDALNYWRQALTVFRETKDQRHEALALHVVALAYRYMERYADAIQNLQSSLRLYQRIKDREKEAGESNSLGDIYSALAYSNEALKYYDSALSLYHELKNPKLRGDEAWVLRNLADVYMQSGDYRSTLHYLNAAVSIYRELSYRKPYYRDTIREMWPQYGDIYMEMGRYEEAQRCYELALARIRQGRDDQEEANLLFSIGYNYSMQMRYEEALKLFERALPTIERAKRRGAAVSILTSITNAYAHLKQPQQAILYGKQAVNLLQSIRLDNQKLEKAAQRAFLAQHRGLYEMLTSLLIQENRLEEAEQVLRFLRQEDAFEFVRREDGLAKGLAGLFDPLVFTPAEKQHLHSEAAKVALIGQGCQESRLWQQDLLEQEKAGRGRAALLSTFNTDSTFYVLLTTARERRAFSVPIKKSDFDALSVRLQRALSHPDEDPLPDAYKMYQIVFCGGRLEQALQKSGITTALWFASGSLRSIPIDTLYDGKDYLVQKPRANVCATLTSRNLFSATTHGLALAAGVSQEHTVKSNLRGEITLKALPSVPQEVRSIVSDTADGGNGPFPGKILLDQQFTAANLEHDLVQGASTVHIATHYVSNNQGIQDPFFLLGDGTRLSLSQWEHTLHLQGVGLLTLSACDTGVGTPDASGGDVSSIGEVSQFLGAQSVVVTLWPVNDASTTELMRDFYGYLHKFPHLGKAKALREAQRALLGHENTILVSQSRRGIIPKGGWNKAAAFPQYRPFLQSPTHPYAHPFYWAPFSLIGNWK
ncbi:hypothetical protein IAD21_06418 (plasmid) [Abditibacteriota bacterium]|nr:hypothetical protein IAD21_06418 [Abditibacteriota bacterium]